jgi:hypothetical protein
MARVNFKLEREEQGGQHDDGGRRDYSRQKRAFL